MGFLHVVNVPVVVQGSDGGTGVDVHPKPCQSHPRFLPNRRMRGEHNWGLAGMWSSLIEAIPSSLCVLLILLDLKHGWSIAAEGGR